MEGQKTKSQIALMNWPKIKLLNAKQRNKNKIKSARQLEPEVADRRAKRSKQEMSKKTETGSDPRLLGMSKVTVAVCIRRRRLFGVDR
jgi:hypothetical protein